MKPTGKAMEMPTGTAITNGVGPDDEPLLTPADVAKRLGMTLGWTYSEIASGRLPHVRLGKYIRVAPAALRQYIAARATGAGR